MGKKTRRTRPGKQQQQQQQQLRSAGQPTPGHANLCWTTPTVTGSAPSPRGGHSAACVGNKVYVFGGADRTPAVFDDFYILEVDSVASVSWRAVAKQGEWPAPRHDHTAIAVGRQIFIMGGQDVVNRAAAGCDSQYLPFTVHVFDTVATEWSTPDTSGAVPTARASHSCVLSHDGSTLAVMAGTGDSGPLNDFFLLDTNTMSELLLAPNFAPLAREMHSCFCLPVQPGGEPSAPSAPSAAAATDIRDDTDPSNSMIFIAGGRTSDAVLDTMEPVNLGAAVLLETEIVGDDEPDLEEVALGVNGAAALEAGVASNFGVEAAAETSTGSPEPCSEPCCETVSAATFSPRALKVDKTEKHSPAKGAFAAQRELAKAKVPLPRPACGQAAAVWGRHGDVLAVMFGGTDMQSIHRDVWTLNAVGTSSSNFRWIPAKVICDNGNPAPLGRFGHTLTAIASVTCTPESQLHLETEEGPTAMSAKANHDKRQAAAILFGGSSFEADLNDVHVLHQS
eukprot:SAG31_NODE_594_length_13670_cov_2.624642_3_plen_508_part_00